MFYRSLILLSLVACATKPTPYTKEHHKEGYRDLESDGLKVSSFKGNSVTKRELATSFAEFRAIDHCRSENLHANIIDVMDKTLKKNITRTSGSSWGPTYWGMYPYYSRFSSIGFSAGFNTINTDSWSETLTYPQIEVYYNCATQVLRPKIFFKEISDEQMKLLVKDLKGALQVEKIDETSPNKDFEAGDIILKAEGKRIGRIYELIAFFSPNKKEVKVSIMREGQKMEKVMKSEDITEKVKTAEEEIISNICKLKNEDEQKDLLKSKTCSG